MIDAAAIWACAQGCEHAFAALVERDCLAEGARWWHKIEVDPWRVVWAVVGDRAAISAPLGDLWANALWREMGERAKGGETDAVPANDPDQKVEVVTALGQDHGACTFGIRPVATDEAMGEVEEAQVLAPVERDDLAEPSAGDDLVDRAEEGSIAQDVRDLQDPPVALGELRQEDRVFGCRRHRLFKKDVVAERQEPDSAGEMLAIHGGVHQPLSKLWTLGKLFPRAKLALGRDMVGLREARTTPFIGLGDGNEPHIFWMAFGVAAVGKIPAVSRADHDELDWLCHCCVSLLLCGLDGLERAIHEHHDPEVVAVG